MPINSQSASVINAKSSGSWFLRSLIYLLHSTVASVGVYLCSMSLGAVIEQMLRARFADSAFTRPPYVGQIVLGFIIGFLVNRRLHSKSAMWAWVFPFLVFLITAYDYLQVGGLGGVWSYLLGAHCGGCIEQILTISPVCSSVAYSLGAWIASRRRANSVEGDARAVSRDS